MSRNQRIGLIVAAALVAVLAFVIASPGSDDEGANKASQTTPAAKTRTDSPAPPEPDVRIRIRGGDAVGGPGEIKVKKGDTVVILVSSDAPDDIHLHGYDIEKKVAPAQPARFRFKANLEGEFEIESHVAEDAGRDPLVGTLIVEPR